MAERMEIKLTDMEMVGVWALVPQLLPGPAALRGPNAAEDVARALVLASRIYMQARQKLRDMPATSAMGPVEYELTQEGHLVISGPSGVLPLPLRAR